MTTTTTVPFASLPAGSTFLLGTDPTVLTKLNGLTFTTGKVKSVLFTPKTTLVTPVSH